MSVVFRTMALAACIAGLTTACTPARTSTSYSSSEAMRAQTVVFGRVAAVRQVDIRPGQTRLGMGTGAILGGIAGSQIGGGTAANIAGGVAGAVAGGALGSALQGSQRTHGIEITVTLESGQSVAIVQPGDINEFRVGDRVRVVGDSENARVTR